MTAATLPTPCFIVSSGSGDPGSIDAYLYGDNARLITYTSGYPTVNRFVTLILATATGGFGAENQAARLSSGLYGGSVFETFEAAYAYLAELKELVLA